MTIMESRESCDPLLSWEAKLLAGAKVSPAYAEDMIKWQEPFTTADDPHIGLTGLWVGPDCTIAEVCSTRTPRETVEMIQRYSDEWAVYLVLGRGYPIAWFADMWRTTTFEVPADVEELRRKVRHVITTRHEVRS